MARRHRWLPAGRWRWHNGQMAGAIVAAFGRPNEGQLSGVQLIHVDAERRAVLDRPEAAGGLEKRDHGHPAGATCVLGLPAGAPGIHVAEGLADALALAARLPWPAVCMRGTAGYRNHALAAGWLATRPLRRCTRGADPGAAGAPLAEILGGAWGKYAADLQRDGLPGWEAERVASVMLAGGVETTGRQGVAPPNGLDRTGSNSRPL